MLVEKIENILRGAVPEDQLAQIVSEVEALYYKYENAQAKLSIDEQKRELKCMLEPFVEKFGPEMLNKFFFYWTEHNKNGKKCRFKLEKVFSINGRLATWKKNNQEREMRQNLLNKNQWVAK